MTVKLQVLNTTSNLRSVQITRTTVIGRAADAGLRIASKKISRRHCELILAADAVRIRDLSSSNGTFVNNKPLIPGVVFELDPGDELRLGSVRFQVLFEPRQVERPVLKQPALDVPKGGLAGAIAAATGDISESDAEDVPLPKVELTQEIDWKKPSDEAASEEPADSTPAGADSFDNLETVDAFELKDVSSEDATSDEPNVDATLEMNFDALLDEVAPEPTPDAEDTQDDSPSEEPPSFEVGNQSTDLDDSAILDFLGGN